MSGDGKRPRVENEAAPGDTMDTTADVDPDVKRRVLGGTGYPSSLLLPQETSCAQRLAWICDSE